MKDVIANYLGGPSTKVVPLDARLPSQAVEEAKQEGCEPIPLAAVTRKSGGAGSRRRLARRRAAPRGICRAAGSVEGATARAAVAGGLQAAAPSLAGVDQSQR